MRKRELDEWFGFVPFSILPIWTIVVTSRPV